MLRGRFIHTETIMSEQFNTLEKKVCYGIGRQLADQLANKPFPDFDTNAAVAGFTDAINGQSSQIDQSTLSSAFNEIQAKVEAHQAEQSKTLAADGEKFLVDNAKRDEVSSTDSGLQYEVLNSGDGDTPTNTSTVRTHYHGTLIDGTVFDSSYDRGEPAEFPVNGVIAGWTEALQIMKTGDKWRLYIPYNLAYGEQGAGGKIAPFSTLIFDIELLAIVS